MEICRANPQDAATLTQIAFAAKRHWGYPGLWIQSWKNVLTIDPEFIASHATYTACVDGKIVGFYALVNESKITSLAHLWVLPNAIGKGVGRALFTHAIQRAKALGIETIEIESDPNAEKFYEHMGARRVGTNVTESEGQPRALPLLIYDCS